MACPAGARSLPGLAQPVQPEPWLRALAQRWPLQAQQAGELLLQVPAASPRALVPSQQQVVSLQLRAMLAVAVFVDAVLAVALRAVALPSEAQ